MTPDPLVAPVVGGTPEVLAAKLDELADALDHARLEVREVYVRDADAGRTCREAAVQLRAIVPRPEPREPEPELLAVLKDVLAQFDAGMFVRNTDSDGCSDWAIKAAKPLLVLARAKAAVDKADAAVRPASAPSLEIPDGWSPTPANVNALQAPLRRYIHQLETACDPAGDQRALILTRDENAMLREKVTEMGVGPFAFPASAPSLPHVRHRSGCAAWSTDHPQEWRAGDETLCNCGARSVVRVLADQAKATSARSRPLEEQDEEIAAIRDFWSRPEPPVFCSACGVEVPRPNWWQTAAGFTNWTCPACHSGAGWRTTITTNGRDAKADILLLLSRLRALVLARDPQE